MKKAFVSHLSPAVQGRLLKKKRVLKIGLTGGIGAGKSMALAFFASQKIPVLQTDQLGHEVLQEKKVVGQLVKAFGREILKGNTIDRARLAQAAFQSHTHQKKLNAIVHPAVRAGVRRWVRERSLLKEKPSFVVVEVPLMFERGFNRFFDGILSISASDKIREKRLKQRGWSRSEIKRRTKLQWSQKRKDQLSDWVIYNQKSEKDLKYALYQWAEPFFSR